MPNWNTFVQGELRALQAALGRDSSGFDPAHPPYAVFDWDNTCVFLDVEDAVTIYQLQNVLFAANPAAMSNALRTGLPADPELHALLEDILQSYAWLFERTGGLEGSAASRESVRGTPQLADFSTKFLRLYQRFEHKHGPEAAYPWLPYRFTGMTPNEVADVTRQAVRWQAGQPIEKVTWTSPLELPGKAGVVEASWSNGLRMLDEMQNLHKDLREAGFDVWICTAAFAEGVRAVSSEPEFGYENPPEHVLGLELERDGEGRYTPRLERGREVTVAAGKTRAIRQTLLPKYGYGPALVAGDSNGDVAMLGDFSDTRISLLIDLARPTDSPIGRLVTRAREAHGRSGERYLLQARDETLGRFRA